MAVAMVDMMAVAVTLLAQIPGIFTTFKAHDTPLFVEGSSFHDPQHYSKLMGYDK